MSWVRSVCGRIAMIILVTPLAAIAQSGPEHQHDHTSAEQSGGFFENLFKSYIPRRVCMDQETPLVWLHVVSDVLIAAAYYSIPVALIYFVRRRRDVAFTHVFVLFAAFILACGTTHIFNVWAIWQPFYKIDGIVKALTAGVSVVTAIALWPLLPKAIALPSPTTLRIANEQLALEVTERRAAEDSLRALSSELETRVHERTEDLERANKQLQAEVEARREAESAERAARTEAEKSNRAKDEFVANLSHELLTPLNAILGWAQILGREQSTKTLPEGLQIIERNARVQAQLISDLMDINRILSGKIRLEVQRVELAPVVEAAIQTVQPAADARNIRLEPVLDPQAGPISGDAARLQQIVWNLLSNAIKFTPKGGKVQILLERVNSHIEITIADTGEGITPEFLPFIFDRFRQADGSSTRRHGGLGLGLSIVKNLVELHGGSVRAESEGPGNGATFVVSLPVLIAKRGDDRPHPTAEPSGPGGHIVRSGLLCGLHLLIVDDEADAAAIVRHIVEGQGATAVTAATAAEALKRLQEDRFAVIVSDIGMPDHDGYALLRRIRSLPAAQGGQTPVIALTAFARSQDRIRSLMAGFHTHIAKPVEAGELIASIANAAGRTGSTDEA